jgi:hypothetical protein
MSLSHLASHHPIMAGPLVPGLDPGINPAISGPSFLLPLWEKVARCGSAASRMRGTPSPYPLPRGERDELSS